MRGALRAVLLVLLLAGVTDSAVWGRPRPGKPGGFRLRARAIAQLAVNRVDCGLSSDGIICVDTSGTGSRGGGYWPKGTNDQYVFASGFQVAGIIGGVRPDNPWAGDTAAAFFFNSIGPGTATGEEVTPIYNSGNPADVAVWPDAARVPAEINEADNLYDPLFHGRTSVSQGDVWWLTWDGRPRPDRAGQHPLGILVEQRGLAWNYPTGNEDIIYFVFTIYNITSTDPAHYSGVRPAMRETLLGKARDFQALNAATSRGTLPMGGYSIDNMYVAFAADMDVAKADENYASVNVPFALGYTWNHEFNAPSDWTFDPKIFGAPFFPGTGFVGVKYLSSPPDSIGQPTALTTFGVYQNVGGGFSDPGSSPQLYRYLAATLSPEQGDGQCNTGNPLVTHICFVQYGAPADLRFFESTGPLSLPPGGFGSVVVAYIFAAPVAVNSCTPPCDVRPGDPTILGDPTRMAGGVNTIDSMAGYGGFTDANGDGRVSQEEFRVVPGSLLGKAQVAQTVFDSRFLLQVAPPAPEFFLIPGNGQVTVLWKPLDDATTADPFFESAQDPTNLLYDPNYRQQDVEGYRIYRGRTQSSLTLLAQYDLAGTTISDFGGLVNPDPSCAPELGVTAGCAVPFDAPVPGVARTVKVDYPLVGELRQIRPDQRALAADGRAVTLGVDTALTGGGAPFPPLRDSGVPFVFVDRSVRNELKYFYAVTAFDINSAVFGPSSLESPRTARPTTPEAPSSNYSGTAQFSMRLLGRGEALDTGAAAPELDATTGQFSGPFPPANDFELDLAHVAQAVLPGSGNVSVTLDSLRLGSAQPDGTPAGGTPAAYFYTASADGDAVQVQMPVLQARGADHAVDSTFFPATRLDPAQAAKFGGTGGFALAGRLALGLSGAAYAGAWGRGCAARAPGFDATGTTGCEYNGARWFDGPSPEARESRANPQAAHPANAAAPGPMSDLNNAGALAAVATVHMPHAYETIEANFAAVEGVLAGAVRAADFNLFWGAAGLIDSVVDVTHGVPVPFDSLRLAGSWGVLNQTDAGAAGSWDQRPDVLTLLDYTCVEPLRSLAAVQAQYPCTSAAPFALSRRVAPGAVAIADQQAANLRTVAARPGPGFALYLAGTLTIFELAGSPPTEGAIWTLRSYVGAISGGRGAAGDRGPYTFAAQPRPLTAVGTELRLEYQVVNDVRAATVSDLRQVHTVPDPYYAGSKFEQSSTFRVIRFVNLPEQAIIRIYSSSGVLLTMLEHRSNVYGGSETWNVLNRNNQVVASGVYFYHIESGDARRVGRFTVVNFAE
ncbi:MAG: hypothetical protein M3Q93_01000 [Gemmatimonadota bacterium]|nr:hypothetical protein [Gemmatimonadota bacterium]